MFDVQAVTSFEFSQEDLALPKAVAVEITNSISAIQGKNAEPFNLYLLLQVSCPPSDREAE